MDDLVQMLTEKLGISPDTARKAILITAHYLKSKLPQNIYPRVEIALELSGVSAEEINDMGLFRYP